MLHAGSPPKLRECPASCTRDCQRVPSRTLYCFTRGTHNSHHDHQVLAVASDDGRVKLYNAANGEPLAELAGHEDAVQAVAFDRGGQFMVSASSDCTFKVWGG